MASVRRTEVSGSRDAIVLNDTILEEAYNGGQLASPTSLLGLPVELQKTILEYVRSTQRLRVEVLVVTFQQLTTNADKKNVCLACKEMQTVVTPMLYKHMEISDRHLAGVDFRNTLKPGHPGLPHARTLCIRSSIDNRDGRLRGGFGSNLLVNANYEVDTICRLMFAIPKNSLTRFE